jgi:hypothetical protein
MDFSSPKFAAIIFLLRCGFERQGILRVAAGACFLVMAGLIAPASGGQEKLPAKKEPTQATPQTKAADVEKGKKAEAESADADEDGDSGSEFDKDEDGPNQIQKRDEWFYQQRSSANGRIPGGARIKAFAHMQRMMEAEGKLVRRADGTFAVALPSAVTTPTWTSIGPAPTSGGTFSPTSGRITTIAVDPSDSSGNTVLIGGAQGGIWRTTDAGVTWTAVGDQNPSLAMGSIAFAASQPATVYAGTGEQASIGFDIYYGAGVLKSTDHGQTWTPTCTVAGPTCPFVGPYLDSLHPGFGFFNFGGARMSYIAVNPQNPNLVLAAVQIGIEGPTEGIYCSNDGGASWSNILPDEMATFVGFASPTTAFAALGMPFGSSPQAPNGNGIYKSTNASQTCSSIRFSRLTNGLPAQSTLGRIELGISPNFATDNTVYASIASSSTASGQNLGVFVTTNGGTSWTQTSAPDICRSQCWYDNVLKVDPINGQHAFFGGSARLDSSGNPNWVLRTMDGNTWSSIIPNLAAGSAGLPHVDNHAMAFVKLPNGKVRMYLGNDGGIWRTDDAEAPTVQWVNLNSGSLSLTQFYPTISIHPATPLTSFGGTQDNSSQQLATAPSWLVNTGTFQTGSGPVQRAVCGDGTSTAIDPNVPSTVYISCQFTSVRASYQTGAAGTFFPAVNGISLQDPSPFVPALLADPNLPNTVYFATSTVYESTDAANSWNAISGNLGTAANPITTLAVAGSTSGLIYAGFASGLVAVETNANTGNFTNFSFVQGQNSLPNRSVTAIASDVADATGRTVYVAYSGFSFVGPDALNPAINISDPQGHIFKTTDGGNTWADVSCSLAVCTTPATTDLPNIPVNDVVIDPDLPGTLYAATDLGVYEGVCGASSCTWSTVGTGLPHVAVFSLRLHEASRTLRAATHGRGVWDLALNNFSFGGPHISSMTPTSASSGGAQLTVTVSGSGLTGGTIEFGGTALAATGTQSDTSLSGTLPASLLVAGTVKVTVKAGALVSNALPFGVLALTPVITTVSPPTTPVQVNPANPVTVSVTGQDFAASAQVLFNGATSGIKTTFNSSTSLTAVLPAALLGPAGGINDITVFNLPPGGGKSVAKTFKVVAPPPPNDNFVNAINISTLNFFDFEDSSGATTETSDPVPPASCVTQRAGNTGGQLNGVYNTIWYKFTPVFSAPLFVETIESTYDTVLSIWTGTAGSLTNVACNDDIVPGTVVQSQLTTAPLTAGTTYYIMVSSFGPPDPNPLALGGGTQLRFLYNNGQNPSPSITSLSPPSVNSGSGDFKLTVNGTDFLNGAQVQFNVDNFATTFVSATQLTATIPEAEIDLPGMVSVAVSNPPPGGFPANRVTFTVNLGTYPVPILTSIMPTSVIATTPGATICAFGSKFAQGAMLTLNGVSQASIVSGSTSLCANLPASQFVIANVGTLQLGILNPMPGGGASSTLPFQIVMPNPIPTITSINPTSAAVSLSNPVTLTINGTNFQNGASIFFNGLPVQATFVSSMQLTGLLFPGSQLSTTGTFPILVTDPPPGGTSNAVNFTVTGPPDFSLATQNGQTSATVTAGQPAMYAMSVLALNSFNGTVNLSCSSPATATTCSASPSSVAGSGNFTVTVTTMKRSGVALPPVRRFLFWPQLLPTFVVAIMVVLLAARFARTRRERLAAAVPLAGLVLFVILHATGCGGGGGGGFVPPPQTGTPAGTYTVTVTATSNGTTPHTAALQLVVN